MYDYFVENPLSAVFFAILFVAIAIFLLVKYVQYVGLEKIRADVYQGFIKAEHLFKEGDNTAKFNYVVELAKMSIPAPFNLVISEALLRKVIQLWFDLCKDLLDDGKLNKSLN